MIEKSIKELIAYAVKHLYLSSEDKVFFENVLRHHFGIEKTYEGEIDDLSIENLGSPEEIAKSLLNDLMNEGKSEEEAKRLISFAFGIVSPRPSQVITGFESLRKKDSEVALMFLKQIETFANYFKEIEYDDILFEETLDNGMTLMFFGNAKDEKEAISNGYPKCPLCYENIGLYGDDNHESGMTLRSVPIIVADEKWYLKLASNPYFNDHFVCFKDEHVTYQTDKMTFHRLLDFVTRFQSLFAGSDSERVPASEHEYIEGGSELLPIFSSKDKEVLFESERATRVSKLNYHLSALRIKGTDKEDMMSIGEAILEAWKGYDNGVNDPKNNRVISYARKVDYGYELLLVLCPSKESKIGLLEAAGLFAFSKREMSNNEDLKQEALKSLEEATAFKNNDEEQEAFDAFVLGALTKGHAA